MDYGSVKLVTPSATTRVIRSKIKTSVCLLLIAVVVDEQAVC